MEQPTDGRNRSRELAAQLRFNFPFLYYSYFGALITARLMKDGRLIGGHLMKV